MRIKINGQDIEPGARVTIESSAASDAPAYTIIIVGFSLIYMIAKGGLFS